PGRIRGVTNSRRNTVTGVEGEIVVVAKYLMLQYTLFVDPLPDPVTLTSAVHGVWSRAQDEIADAGNIEASEKSLDLKLYELGGDPTAIARRVEYLLEEDRFICPSDGYEEITFRFLAPQIADTIYECFNETIAASHVQYSAIPCGRGELGHSLTLRSSSLRPSERNAWRGFPRATQELMLRNLRETIMDKVNQENRVLKERHEGFADNHEAVHAELERQLSSRNPRRPAAREPTPINTGARGLVGRLESQLERELSSQEPRLAAAREPTPINTDGRVLEGHQESQDASQESAKSFDFSQWPLLGRFEAWMLNLTLEQEQESAANPDLASRLSLSLDDFQEDQAAAGENVRQNGDEVI
ncbi:hypothetical protein B9Z19DRAFT_1069350, partial [Tuber borchii]